MRRPSRVEDFRTLTASKLALSSSRLSVSSSISESRPPIMPAMATGWPLQQIIRVFSSTVRCVPSKVVNWKGASKRFTSIWSTLAQSKACMGWPISSIR